MFKHFQNDILITFNYLDSYHFETYHKIASTKMFKKYYIYYRHNLKGIS